MFTEAIQNYLKEIWALETASGRATTIALAGRLGVAPASATGMLKRLATLGLVERRPYQGVVLTERGRATALAVVRRHRLLELFLAERLGVPLAEVHAEAERLEHALSPALAERIAAQLGHPDADPHGALIPDAAGALPAREQRPLAALAVGEGGVVVEVPDQDPDLVRYLVALGLVPGARLAVVARAPYDGPLTVRVAGVDHAVGSLIAGCVHVRADGGGSP